MMSTQITVYDDLAEFLAMLPPSKVLSVKCFNFATPKNIFKKLAPSKNIALPLPL
jgi:hypothetical protein